LVDLEQPRSDEAGWVGLPDLGSVLQQAWHGLRSSLAHWVTNFLAVLGGFAIWAVALYLVRIGAVDEYGYREPLAPAIVLLFSLVFIGLAFVAAYGLFRSAVLTARGMRPTAQAVWQFDRIGPFALVMILVGAMGIGLGSVVPIVGLLVASALLFYAPFFVLDGRTSAIDAVWRSVSRSTRTSSRFTWQLVLAVLVYGLLSAVLALALLPLILASAMGLLTGGFVSTVVLIIGVLGAVCLAAIGYPLAATVVAVAHVEYEGSSQP
jgi:hypothetical protein